jgi:hypothetical protein
MPERRERFFWLHTKQTARHTADAVDAANQTFARSWSDSRVECVRCVTTAATSDRLWLFRIGSADQQVASRFNSALTTHLKGLPSAIAAPHLSVKRQVNLPTPLVCRRLDEWPKTDIGLHVVNDVYNAMLVTFTYHEGRFYNPPHLQLVGVDALAAAVRTAWSAVACECKRGTPGCCGTGCYDCFQAGCPRCDGTGWKDFSRWVKAGYAIDYSSGFPLAQT